MITLSIKGVVKEEESGVPQSGLHVKAYDKDLLFDDLLGSAPTDGQGRFAIVTELRDFRDLFERKPDVYFRVYRADRTTPLYSTGHAVLWNATHLSNVEIRIPWRRLRDPKAVSVRLTGDDGLARGSFAIGESLSIAATGLRRVAAHDIRVSSGGRELFASRLLSDTRGEIEPTIVWPQIGLDDPTSARRFTLDEAEQHWAGRAVMVVTSTGRDEVMRTTVRLESAARRPLVVASDRDGRLLNAVEVDEQPVHLAMRSLPFTGRARVYLVPRQHDWQVGDPIAAATGRDGRPTVREIDVPDTRRAAVVEVLPAGTLAPGAYDFIVRPIRYGYEEDESLHVLATDVVGSRKTTGLIVRENFWRAKPVLGGCVNKISLSGRTVTGAPYFEYSDTFAVGEDVWAALDPGIVDPGNIGKMCALYVIANKTEAQWNADNSLTHLAVLGGNAAVQKLKLQAGCVNANKVKVWPAAMQPGEYDIVADFGNNVADAAMFVPDNQYDTPLDVIDGYFVAGFRVVEDPGTFTEPGLFAGAWDYTETSVAALGLPGTVTVDDENTFYASPGAFAVLQRQVQLKAHVRFPADAAGITDPAQISASRPDYPLVVIVHGNGHDYTKYDFLLDHLAKNGFIAASIDNRYLNGVPVHGMHGLGRANNFFKHLEVLELAFGGKAQNNIGVMGHSRGGEAVLKIARLNSQQALGHQINAVMSLAPTDQYGREVLGGAWAAPYFVLYGSRDGDVSAPDPAAYGLDALGFTWRMSGFSLWDRAADAKKSMVFVYRATHNGFITSNSDNGEAGVLDPAKQQTITRAYLTAFFRRFLRSEAQWDGIFSGEWTPPSVAATGAECYPQSHAPGGKTVDAFEGAPNWQISTIGGAVAQTGLPANPGEGRLFDFAPTTPGLDTHSPHDTQGLQVTWDSAGDRVTFTVPPAHADVTAFGALSVRITQKEASASNPANLPQDLRIALKDGGGNERAIRASAFGALPYPDQRADADLRKSAMSTIRIPLTAYTIVCAGQPKVNLQDVTEISLQFSMTVAGELEVDDLEFTN